MDLTPAAIATEADLPEIKALLAASKLPAEDVGAATQRFLVVRDGPELAGCVALEGDGPDVLLRSLAVAPGRQGHGLGQALHEQALELARAAHARQVWLLTTTAAKFFDRAGYERVERGTAPPALQASPEFKSLCPSTAVCMTRRLGA
jgi:amino-acid N-acetyltransferase